MNSRRKSLLAHVGHVPMGGSTPIVVQSMTNTDTADIDDTVKQIIALHDAGSELVRITVNNKDAAAAVPYIVDKLDKKNVEVPIIGDFHYNGHVLLTEFPDCAAALSKYRINPGNTGTKTRDKNFCTIVEQAVRHGKPVRIGVNWGSLDQQLLAEKMDLNNALPDPKSSKEVMIDTMIESALRSTRLAEDVGQPADKIIVSCKISGVQDLITVYRRLSVLIPYPLHLGLTEAGMGMKGIVASASALGVLLNEGIGDTIRVSLTPPAGWRPCRGGTREPTDPPIPRHPQFHTTGDGLPRLRPNQEHLFPGTGGRGPDLPPRYDAGMARDLPGRRRPAGRRDGLRGERTGRIQTCEHRHLTSRHLRRTQSTGLYRWRTCHHPAW